MIGKLCATHVRGHDNEAVRFVDGVDQTEQVA